MNEARHAMFLGHKYSGNTHCIHEVDFIQNAAYETAEDEILWQWL